MNRASSQIILNSMHRYQPRFHVVLVSAPGGGPGARVADWSARLAPGHPLARTLVFAETKFFAVTAYQNHRVRSAPVAVLCHCSQCTVLVHKTCKLINILYTVINILLPHKYNGKRVVHPAHW